MKQIALIQPNSPFLINERVFPNIGLVRVATTLKNEGHKVDLYDFSGKDTDTIKQISKDYDYYGFSSTTPQFPYVMKIFNKLKETNPSVKTIIGGPHPTALYHLKEKGLKDININDLEVFDTIFAGEGEETSNLFKEGWQKGKIIKNIDNYLIPNRDFLDLKSYTYNLFGKDTTSIQTQRGCPHKCAFCSGRDVEMYNKVRSHSPERVLEELDELNIKYGYSSFMLYDDEVNLNMGRLEKLCNMLEDRDYQFRAFVRSDNIVKYPESVKWMKNAGFVKLATGVESGSDRILKILNKKTTSKINSEAREIIRKNGIHYEAFLIIGHPGEEMQDINKTLDWVYFNKPDDFDLNILTPYPGSKIYDEAIPSKKFKNYKWEWNGLFLNKPRYAYEDSFYKGIDKQSESNVRTTKFTNYELRKIRDSADAYLRRAIKYGGGRQRE
jgi:anaerobic magnesium-protoporphyrin IX monomethyl ester cyclase